MKKLLKFSSKTNLVCLCLGFFLTASIVPAQAQVTKRDHRTKEKIQPRDHRTNKGPLIPIKKIRYLGQHPRNQDNNWSDNLQGVTHDANNWYFTQLTKLWKFPFGHDLAKKLNGPNPNQKIYQIQIPPELAALGYDHFCDLDFFDGYLFVPLEDKDSDHVPLLVVYKADNLQYIGHVKLQKQSQAGWCAIHPITKELYTSNNHLDQNNPSQKIYRYTIDFNRLKQEEVKITFNNYFDLYNESGSSKLDIKRYMQGGDFSEDGQYLYLVNGRGTDDTPEKDGGVWIFDGTTGRKFTKSFSSASDFNSTNNPKTYINENFKYEYHPGWSKYEEPEGITVGNVDGKGAPNIKGQVHVIMLDNNAGEDGVYFKHYQIIK